MKKDLEQDRKVIASLEDAKPKKLLAIWKRYYKGITAEEAQEATQGLLDIVNYKGNSIEEIDRLCSNQEDIERRLSEKYGGSIKEPRERPKDYRILLEEYIELMESEEE